MFEKITVDEIDNDKLFTNISKMLENKQIQQKSTHKINEKNNGLNKYLQPIL